MNRLLFAIVACASLLLRTADGAAATSPGLRMQRALVPLQPAC